MINQKKHQRTLTPDHSYSIPRQPIRHSVEYVCCALGSPGLSKYLLWFFTSFSKRLTSLHPQDHLILFISAGAQLTITISWSSVNFSPAVIFSVAGRFLVPHTLLTYNLQSQGEVSEVLTLLSITNKALSKHGPISIVSGSKIANDVPRIEDVMKKCWGRWLSACSRIVTLLFMGRCQW